MSISPLAAFQEIEKISSSLLTQIVPLEEAINRVIASDVYALYPLPRFDNSAMDGYVARMENKGASFCVNLGIFAGDRPTQLPQGEISKIMTGAPVPQGGECVIPIEDVHNDNGTITLPETIKEAQHIRKKGEDISQEELLIQKGKILSWGDIAILASQGLSHIMVYRQPRVVIFATGEELVPHYQSIEAHQIYNSNSPMLFAKAKQHHADVSFLKASQDTLDSIKNNIRNALESDLIITTGGASVGDADLTKKALLEMGMEEIFTKIDIKPGKPTSLGKIGKTYVLILPGNPLACGVNFALFGTTLLNALSGASSIFPLSLPTKLTENVFTKGGIATVILGHTNALGFTPLDKQGPNMVSPLAKANSLLILDPQSSKLHKGDDVTVVMLESHNTSSYPPYFS